ncbi:MAG TPA: hypothetical protein VIC08_11470 [Cellvibrionaceae bacterium]
MAAELSIEEDILENTLEALEAIGVLLNTLELATGGVESVSLPEPQPPSSAQSDSAHPARVKSVRAKKVTIAPSSEYSAKPLHRA